MKLSLGLLLTIVALILGLLGSFYSFGQQIGTLTTQVQAQTKQIDLLQAEVKGINGHLIQWVGRHERVGP